MQCSHLVLCSLGGKDLRGECAVQVDRQLEEGTGCSCKALRSNLCFSQTSLLVLKEDN